MAVYISSLLKKKTHTIFMREGQCQIRFDGFFFGFMSRGKEGENYIISFFIDIIHLFLRESVYRDLCW